MSCVALILLPGDGPHGVASLTPAEREVVRLVCDGLPNKDIATRLFVSPRTVQAHLTHIYTKLSSCKRQVVAPDRSKQSWLASGGAALLEPVGQRSPEVGESPSVP